MYSWLSIYVDRRAIAAFLLAGAALSAAAETLQGRVISISDGDTIAVLDQNKVVHKVRLSGIDAPEKKQAFGTASKDSLASIVFGKTVVIDYQKRDRYGRLIGKVSVGVVDANMEQLNRGMAWWYRDYADEQPPTERQAYERAEDDARAFKRGLWRDNGPVPPWRWRAQARQASTL